MYTLKVRNEQNEIYDITGGEYHRVLSIDGLSPAAAEISTSDAVGYDGSIFTYGRCGSRNITIQLAMTGDIEESRQELYRFFVPKKTVRLFFSNANRDVYIDGYVETVDIDLFSQLQTADISIICPMPYFINNSNAEYTMTTAENNVLERQIVGGEIESGIIADITLYAPSGTYSPIVIENIPYNQKITINNDVYRGIFKIDTNPGEKQATYKAESSHSEQNIINQLDIYKRQWITIKPGYNLIRLSIPDRTLSISDAVTAKITAYRYFIGV